MLLNPSSLTLEDLTGEVLARDGGEIFLELPDGKERALSLSGFAHLGIREGHVISAILAMTGRSARKGKGWYIAVYNHATEETAWGESTIVSFARVPLLVTLGVFVGTWIVFANVAIAIAQGQGVMAALIIGPVVALVAAGVAEFGLKALGVHLIKGMTRRFIDEKVKIPRGSP